jgi:hypothetical protein
MPAKRAYVKRNRGGFLATPESRRKPRSAPVFMPVSLPTTSRPCRCNYVLCATSCPTRLDNRHAGEGSWFRLRAAPSTGKVDRRCTAPRNRCRAGVASGPLGPWAGRLPTCSPPSQELEHLGVGFVSLTEALDLTTPAGSAMAALRLCSPSSNARFCANAFAPDWPTLVRMANASAGPSLPPCTPIKSVICSVPAQANRKSHGVF